MKERTPGPRAGRRLATEPPGRDLRPGSARPEAPHAPRSTLVLDLSGSGSRPTAARISSGRWRRERCVSTIASFSNFAARAAISSR